MKELIAIQTELKAPKSNFNSFGKYAYRSLEDIFEALKPLLAKHKCYVSVSDEIVLIGDRYYIKATATIRNDSGDSVSVSAMAREEESKKGMDSAQLTGATSSYARKYALNGLFAIDDTKDADATNTHDKEQHKAPAPSKASEDDRQRVMNEFQAVCKTLGVKAMQVIEQNGGGTTDELKAKNYDIVRKLMNMDSEQLLGYLDGFK